MSTLTWEIVDKIAAGLGASAGQRRKWRQTGRQVPNSWRIRIAEAIKGRGEPIDFSAFDDLPPRPGKLSVHSGDICAAAAVPTPGKRNANSRTLERNKNNV
ncbi:MULTISPECIES: hypothetical protein [Sphingomonas]|uniref:hypothetical protein n=1 Tax=Sphingomonas TaxID=13687 RepID=UPI00254B40FC|nr:MULTISPECIES: hypothetical protein [Sphingomonas]MDK8187747.1 hypothetical protein [Sphingomonas zeae]MDK8217602.1 hypothetical protein [Sphingomonas sp. UMB7805-LC452B]